MVTGSKCRRCFDTSADVQLLVEKQNLVQAQAQTRAYGYGLAQLLGLKGNQYIDATETLSAEDDQGPDEKQSLAEAFDMRPDLLSAKALSQAANLDRSAAASRRILSYAECFLFMTMTGVVTLPFITLMAPFVFLTKHLAAQKQLRGKECPGADQKLT